MACVVCKVVDQSLSYHRQVTLPRFPKSKPLFCKWLKILELNPRVTGRNSTICSKHFHESCYSAAELLPGALPDGKPYRPRKKPTNTRLTEITDSEQNEVVKNRVLEKSMEVETIQYPNLVSIDSVNNEAYEGRNNVPTNTRNISEKCCVCKTKDTALSYYSFPENVVLRQHWLEALHLKSAKQKSKICSHHFHSSCFYVNQPLEGLRLLPGAIPGQNPYNLIESGEMFEFPDEIITNLDLPEIQGYEDIFTEEVITTSDEGQGDSLKSRNSEGEAVDEPVNVLSVDKMLKQQKPGTRTVMKTTSKVGGYCYCFLCQAVDESRSHHKFPQNPELRTKWLQILNLEDVDLDPRAKICSKHFHPSCYFKTSFISLKLLPGALPDQNPYKSLESRVQGTTVVNKLNSTSHTRTTKPSKAKKIPQSPSTENKSFKKKLADHDYRFAYCVICKVEDESSAHHNFPKNLLLRKKWLDVLNVDKSDLKTRSTICSKHFHESCYSTTSFLCRRLLPMAVPDGQPYSEEITIEVFVEADSDEKYLSGNHHKKTETVLTEDTGRIEINCINTAQLAAHFPLDICGEIEVTACDEVQSDEVVTSGSPFDTTMT